MSRPSTQINLAGVEDAAPAGGFGDRWEARAARVDVEADQTGVTHFRLGLASVRRSLIGTRVPRRCT